jgi:hypothetical protein
MSAFETAWLVVKGIPWKGDWGDSHPIGTFDNKKVIMHNGRPYYQSTGTSGTPMRDGEYAGKKAYKRENAWYGFGGIDTEDKFGMGDTWWIKGKHPDISRHANVSAPTFDEKTQKVMFEPNLVGQSVGNLANRNPDHEWEQLPDAATLNARLAERGWNQ